MGGRPGDLIFVPAKPCEVAIISRSRRGLYQRHGILLVGDSARLVVVIQWRARPRRRPGADKPLRTVSGVRLTAELRELERNKIVDEMPVNPARVSDYPPQTVAGRNYPAVQYRGDYGTFIVLFDPATSLPAIVRTRDFDVLEGDSDYDETLSDWRDVGRGVKMPFHQLVTLNATKIFDTTLTEVSFCARINPEEENEKCDLKPFVAIQRVQLPSGLRSRIHQRANRNHPLSKAQENANRQKSKVRARIEHVFGAQQNSPGGRIVRTIGIARAKAKIGLQNLAYNIRRLVTLERMAAA
jgi:hypothetical protein